MVCKEVSEGFFFFYIFFLIYIPKDPFACPKDPGLYLQ